MSLTAIREALREDIVTRRTSCRMCGGTKLDEVWSFGETPLANSYLTPEEAKSADEPFAPLDVSYCSDCHLVQLLDVVNPHALFDHYLYVSSTSPTFVRHFEDYAAVLRERFALTADSLVVDVGSNDGVLLKPLQTVGINVLGIDPAKNVADVATAEGIPTIAEYFTPDVAEKIVAEQGTAAVISANNVFAHTDDVATFTQATKTLLAPDGVFVFEVQYLGDLVAKNLFDIVYHEHVNYYSVHPMIPFFERHELEVFDVERPAVHGGSLRVFVQHQDGPHSRSVRLDAILHEEKVQGLTNVQVYRDFAARIKQNGEVLRKLLANLKADGKRIVGYGAPAKATTLCYAFSLDATVLDYIVDDAPLKQGMVMPGTHIPIHAPDVLYDRAHPANYGKLPDYCLVLAWNFAEPIMQNHDRFADAGGRFIIPVPKPKII